MTTTFLTEGAFGRTAKSRGRRSSSTITVLAAVCKQLIVNSDDFGGNYNLAHNFVLLEHRDLGNFLRTDTSTKSS